MLPYGFISRSPHGTGGFFSDIVEVMPYSSRTFDKHFSSLRAERSNLKKSRLPRPAKAGLAMTTRRRPLGYSLIELLVVIAIFGITISLVTASYLTFERNQRFKNAAFQLKNDIRYAQNQALTGVKGADTGAVCPRTTTSVLGGWYISMTLPLSTSYQLSGVCLTVDAATGGITAQTTFGSKTINLPRGVRICTISTNQNTNILFQALPTGANATFFNGNATPPFYNQASGNLVGQIGAGSVLTISLNSVSSSGTYNVVVQPTGEVNETKIASGC